MSKKTDKIALLQALIVTQMNHWSLFPIFVMLNAIYKDLVNKNYSPLFYILVWSAFGVLPFVLYLSRIRINMFWALFLFHAVFVLLMFFIPTPHLAIQIIYIIVGLYYVTNSILLWLKTSHKKDLKINPGVSVSISAAMLFLLNSLGEKQWTTIFLTIFIILLSAYYIAYYIQQYQNFLEANASSAGYIPEKEIFRSNIQLVIVYACISSLALLLISNIEWLGIILYYVRGITLTLIIKLFSRTPRTPQPEATTTSAEIVDTTPEPVAAESSPVWNFLENILQFVLVVVIAFLLIKLIIFLVKFFQNKSAQFQAEDSKEIVKDDVYDVREKCDIKQDAKQKKNLPFLNLAPQNRIRQLYKKRLLASQTVFSKKNKDVSSLAYYTARESSQILERDELALIYEKARYSNEECTTKDVKQMKNACK